MWERKCGAMMSWECKFYREQKPCGKDAAAGSYLLPRSYFVLSPHIRALRLNTIVNVVAAAPHPPSSPMLPLLLPQTYVFSHTYCLCTRLLPAATTSFLLELPPSCRRHPATAVALLAPSLCGHHSTSPPPAAATGVRAAFLSTRARANLSYRRSLSSALSASASVAHAVSLQEGHGQEGGHPAARKYQACCEVRLLPCRQAAVSGAHRSCGL